MEKWRRELRDAVTDPAELAELVGASETEIRAGAVEFPLRIPRGYLQLIREKNDGIYRQCVPDPREAVPCDDLMDDPLAEDSHSPVPAVVHRYPDHCLFLASNRCAMHCRFCTRKRRFRGAVPVYDQAYFDAGISCVAARSELRDVLISGGDPLLLEDDELEYILRGLHAIDHVEILRIGTRVPCTLPSRITPKLVKMLRRFPPLYMNVHFNHPDELTPESRAALARLADAGIVLGSQTVLLKGVNDDPATITRLMRGLLSSRVRPYYLLQCDLVYGTAHFRTPLSTGPRIIDALRGWTSGLAVPHFIVDLPRGGGKVALTPEHIADRRGRTVTFRTYCGELREYPEIDGTIV